MSFTRTRTFSRKPSSATNYVAKPKVDDLIVDDLDRVMDSDTDEELVKKAENKVDKQVPIEKKAKVGVKEANDKENAVNTSTKPSTPSKSTSSKRAASMTPTKSPAPKRTKNATPTKSTPKKATPTPTTTPTKATPKKATPTTTPTKDTPKKATPTKRTPPKKTTPSKLTRTTSEGGGPKKSPSRLPRTSTTVEESYYKSNKMIDELEYIFDGIDTPAVMGDCIFQLAKMTRTGGQAISLALNSQGYVARLADVIMNRWGSKEQSLKGDFATVLGITIILHSLATDGVNIPPLTRCIPLLHSILDADSWAPKGKNDEYTKMAKLVDGVHFSNDYMHCEANAQMFALRTLAALTFTRQAIGDTLRTQGVIESVVNKLADIVSKINPESPSLTSLFDIKYALVFLENAATLSAENRTHMEQDSPLLPTLLKFMDIAHGCVANISGKEGLLDAVADCINGVLKSLLNITYNCDSACVKVAAGSDRDTKGSKGLQVLTSLLSISFPGIEKFDVQQHTIGLLVNLVEANTGNRTKFGSIDGAIEQVVNVFLEAGLDSDTTSTTVTVTDLEELVEGKVRAAYAAMLLGCLLRDNSANLKTIRELLLKHKIESLTPLVHILKQFVLFQAKAGILASEVYKSTQEIVQYIQSIENPTTNRP